MATEVVDSGPFDIARVIQQTFGVLKRNIATFSILGVVLAGIPTALVAFVQFGMMRSQVGAITSGTFDFTLGNIAGASFGGVAALVATAILQGALIYATVQDLNGQRPSVGASLATGLRNFLPLLAVTLLFVLAVAFGMILLIVPGIMIACAWCVAVPALVADRTGILGAFSRAAELTRGNRWQIFGLAVIVWIALVIIGLIFNAIMGVSMIAGDPARVLERVLSPTFLVFSVIRSTISSVIGATAIAVIYVELRRAREGGSPQWLADIFS